MEFARKPTRKILSAAILSIIGASTAYAGGFSLYGEGNGSNAGNYAAGVAAEAADASTGWYNPAGLALIRNQQVVGAFTGVFPKVEFTGNTRYSVLTSPVGGPAVGAPVVGQVNSLNISKDGLVPAFHFAQPLGENATAALSVVAPFGLATDAGGTSTRYSASYTKVVTVNVSPEIGGRISENFAIGAGIDFQHAHVNFGRYLGDPQSALALGLPATYYDSSSVNKGDSNSMGFHAGFLVMLNENHTRVGLNYQSKVKHKFHGDSVLTGKLAGPVVPVVPGVTWSTGGIFTSNTLQSNVAAFPEITTLSVYHDVNDNVALLGSVVYTGWDVFKEIVLNNVAGPGNPTAFGSNLLLSSPSSTNYKNTWRFAVCANYKANEKFMLRVGGGYDETPTNNIDRDIRLPDASRWAFAIGGHYQVREDMGVDFGWTHLWMGEGGSVNKTERTFTTQSIALNPASFRVFGDSKGHADLIGIQGVWTIDGVAPAPTK